MKIVVIGAGRMGTRRISLLRALGERDITVFDVDYARALVAATDSGISLAADAQALWDWRPDVVFICTPPDTHDHWIYQAYLHGPQAIFVEKPLATAPLSHDIVGITQCGCNLRYHPGPIAVKRWLDDRVIGAIEYANLWAGYYLPTVRPDYRISYVATTGVILDTASHLVDLAGDWFGTLERRWQTIESASGIGLPDIDGKVQIRFWAHPLVPVDIAADICTPGEVRQGAIISGEYGVISYHWQQRMALWRLKSGVETERVTWDESATERMYSDETAHFLDCVRQGVQTCNPISRATTTLALLLEARTKWAASTSAVAR
jgi:predicted dehydrogenase